MFQLFRKLLRSRRILTAVGILAVGWAAYSGTEGVASGEFVLTDRIGEGTILHLASQIRPEHDGHVLYFQGGKPLHLAELKVDQPYCRFQSTEQKLGERLSQFHHL